MFAVSRIIPAYAGSTGLAGAGRLGSWDHPRIRGEHFPTPGGTGPCQGSSPHTRGAPDRGGQVFWVVGIIPAYAGSTANSNKGIFLNPDHPRIRGEHRRRRHERLPTRGSSPHTRGAPTGTRTATRPSRIIPAYAGSTWRRTGRRPRTRDHPRIRGEHCRTNRMLSCSMGSSPHTRGAPPLLMPSHKPLIIIPAYAGSTRPRR